jgi:xanthine phosphoribosyltransferase
VLFAKKHRTSNVSGVLYQTLVHSYTHGTDYTVVVEREYLKASDRVLIVDDFLANGKAIEGLLDLISQAGAEAAGAGIVIEKGFQEGGRKLREEGLRVESLAIVDQMDENGIVFRK